MPSVTFLVCTTYHLTRSSVGTQGAIKGLTAEQLEKLDVDLILGNTYFLSLRPGAEMVDKMGGLHTFASWRRAMLTDSGGFQMVCPTRSSHLTILRARFLYSTSPS